MKNAIEITNLKKVYEGGMKALNGISFDIPKGSFYGILGPNGAGKTTTIGILTGLIKITGGQAKILGYDVVENFREARKRVGLAPQELNFDVFFSIEELLIMQGGYYGLPYKVAKERTRLMLNQFGLEKKRKSKARELSGGMKRRVQIAKALIHDPPIIILDEPTAGVDIELRHMLWDYLRELNSGGKTILLTTHYIEEAEKLCDTVSIIDDGKIIVSGTPKSLIQKYGMPGLEIKINKDIEQLDLSPFNFNLVDKKIFVETKDPEINMPKVIEMINNYNVRVEEIKISKSSLEEVFLELTGKSINKLERK